MGRIEAMACGTPVVALRGGAVPEIVADGVTGIICDEPADLGRAVHAAAGISPAACRAHVATSFGVDHLARGYEAAYRAAMDRHRAARAPRADLVKPVVRIRDAAPNRRRVPVRPAAQSARR
jgi:hypothetical protein